MADYTPDTPLVARLYCPGCEPEVDPTAIDRLLELMDENPSALMATAATPLRSREALLVRVCPGSVLASNDLADDRSDCMTLA